MLFGRDLAIGHIKSAKQAITFSRGKSNSPVAHNTYFQDTCVLVFARTEFTFHSVPSCSEFDFSDAKAVSATFLDALNLFCGGPLVVSWYDQSVASGLCVSRSKICNNQLVSCIYVAT